MSSLLKVGGWLCWLLDGPGAFWAVWMLGEVGRLAGRELHERVFSLLMLGYAGDGGVGKRRW